MAKGDKRRKRLEELGPLTEENAALIDSWIRSLRTKRMSRNTIAAYRTDIEQLARSYAHGTREGEYDQPGTTPLQLITGPGLMDWLVDRSDGDREEPEWSPATINRKLAAIRQFYRWLIVLRGVDIPNPSEHLENARLPKGVPKFLEAEDLQAIFSLLEARIDGGAMPGATGAATASLEVERTLALIDYLVAGLCYYWGLRISEAVELKWNDFRLEYTGDFTALVHRKGNEVRVFPSQPQLVAHVHSYLAVRSSIRVRSAKHREFFFLHPRTGRAFSRQTVFQRLRATAIAALGEKGKHVSPHWLRHSLARHLLDRGYDIELVRDALQHKRLDTTSVYLKAREGEVQEVLRAHDLEDAARARAQQLDERP